MHEREDTRHIREISLSTRWVFYAKIANALLAIGYIAFLARSLTTTELATYATLTIFAAWGELFTGLGFGTMLQQQAAELLSRKRYDAARCLISSSLGYRGAANLLLLAGVVAAWLLGLLEPYAEHFSIPIMALFLVSVPSTLLSFLAGVQGSVQRFNRRAQISILTSALQKGLSISGLLLFGIPGFFAGYGIGTTTGVVLSLLDLRHYLAWKFYPFVSMFRRSYKFYGLGYFNSVVDKVDRPLIGILVGAEGLAVYHLAKGLYENLNGLAKAMLLPAMVKLGDVKGQGREVFTAFVFNTLTVLLFVFVPLGCFVMAAGGMIVTLLYGEKYLVCGPLLSAFGPVIVARFLWLFLRGIVLRTCSINLLIATEVTTALAVIALYFTLLPRFGTLGIPFALLSGIALGVSLFALALKRAGVVRFPLANFANAFSLGLTVAAAVWLIASEDGGLLGFVLALLASTLIYLFWMARVYPRQYLESYVVYFNLTRFLPRFRSA